MSACTCERLMHEPTCAYDGPSIADLAGQLAASELARAALAEACTPLTLIDFDDLIVPLCVFCKVFAEHRDEIEHKPSCPLASHPNATAQDASEKQRQELERLGLSNPTLPDWLLAELDAADQERMDRFLNTEAGQRFLLEAATAELERRTATAQGGER